MIAIVAPEPKLFWLAPLLADLRGAETVVVFAPPMIGAARWASRSWTRGRADRQMAARSFLRRLTDELAARWLPADTQAIYAPSLAARAVFAVAAARGIPRVLIEDLPWFRQLHDDLDAAAARWPACRFLSRYRAPAALVARQEIER